MTLDIVIPAHNEEHRIDHTLRAYRSRVGSDVRFLVALDRCVDRTAEVVERHRRADGRVDLLEFPKLGKGGVLIEAFRRTRADLVGFVDADCATPPGEFLRLVEVARRTDGAIASRRHPAAVVPVRRTLRRRIASAAFPVLVHRLFGLPYADTQCGAKVVRREVVEEVLPFVSSRDFLFDVDLLLAARRRGFRIVEVPTIWIDREGSRVRAVADAGEMAASAVRLWLQHRLMPVPADGLRPPRSGPAPAPPGSSTSDEKLAGVAS